MNKRSLKLPLFSGARGSAALEFTLLVVPFLLTATSVIGTFSGAYAINVLRDGAIEGARFAALADQSTIDGCARARELISKGLKITSGLSVWCEPVSLSSHSYEKVSVELHLPVLGLFQGQPSLKAQSLAPREIQ
ncbi:MAG: hypothetical protein RIS51_153 [Actinomycetota bacterium]